VGDLAVVFQAREECERACRALRVAAAPFRLVEPPAAVAEVAVPFLVIPDEARSALHAIITAGAMVAGHVPYREPAPGRLDCPGRGHYNRSA
jgi:hypothetical protein